MSLLFPTVKFPQAIQCYAKQPHQKISYDHLSTHQNIGILWDFAQNKTPKKSLQISARQVFHESLLLQCSTYWIVWSHQALRIMIYVHTTWHYMAAKFSFSVEITAKPKPEHHTCKISCKKYTAIS